MCISLNKPVSETHQSNCIIFSFGLQSYCIKMHHMLKITRKTMAKWQYSLSFLNVSTSSDEKNPFSEWIGMNESMYSICGVRVSVRIRQVVVPLFWLMNINYMLCDIQGWFIQILKVCHHFLTLMPFQTCLTFYLLQNKSRKLLESNSTAPHRLSLYVRARLRDTQIRMPPANLKTTQSLCNNVVSNDSLHEGAEKQGHD